MAGQRIERPEMAKAKAFQAFQTERSLGSSEMFLWLVVEPPIWKLLVKMGIFPK